MTTERKNEVVPTPDAAAARAILPKGGKSRDSGGPEKLQPGH